MIRYRIWSLRADRAVLIGDVYALTVEMALSWARLHGAAGALHAVERLS